MSLTPSSSRAQIEISAAPPDAEVRFAAKAETERRRHHANAQARYREKNLNDTRAKARLRMQRLRARRALSEEDKKLAAERRREVDADYRELRRKKKFIDVYGLGAYINTYIPLHAIYGPHIVRKKYLWADLKKKSKPKAEPRRAP